MLQNRTTISRATAFAVVMAAGAMPCSSSFAGVGATPQFIRLDDFRALKQSSAWSTLRGKLQRWRTLTPDWDGEGGISPSEFTIEACRVLLNELESVDAPAPTAAISGDGEIVFEWIKGDGYASISQTDDGHMIAFLREPGFDDPVRIDEPFNPEMLTPFLNRIGAFV